MTDSVVVSKAIPFLRITNNSSCYASGVSAALTSQVISGYIIIITIIIIVVVVVVVVSAKAEVSFKLQLLHVCAVLAREKGV